MSVRDRGPVIWHVSVDPDGCDVPPEREDLELGPLAGLLKAFAERERRPGEPPKRPTAVRSVTDAELADARATFPGNTSMVTIGKHDYAYCSADLPTPEFDGVVRLQAHGHPPRALYVFKGRIYETPPKRHPCPRQRRRTR
jgi:hypothetical protein